MAKLNFVYGAMNSGKSDTLIKTAYNYTEQGLNVVTVKPKVDTKGGNKIVARAGGQWQIDLLADKDANIESFLATSYVSKGTKVHCVLVDEAQLLKPNQIDQLYEIAKLHDISVVAYGIRTDFQSKVFPGSQRLFELADNISKLVTMCRCGEQAEFNCRQMNGDYVFDGSQVAIDGFGEVAYSSLCGNCYYKEKIRYNSNHKGERVSRTVSEV
ncbi:thymidine kinase [Candidatus Saccharibacteria bacterium]|nr:thymidine kinase [Candidatus Saccharibacteria bacterium]